MFKIKPLTLIDLYHSPQLAITLSDMQWQSIILILRQQQLLARYAHKFIKAGVLHSHFPDYAKHHLSNSLILAERQREQILYETNQLTHKIKPHSKLVIFLKGAAYILINHPVSLGRICGDIDLLVEKSGLEEIEQTLCLDGWFAKEINDYDEKYYRQWAHEIPPLQHHSRGTILDVHHNIVPPISGKAPNIELLINEKHDTKNGHQVLTKVGLTLHSCVHLFFNEDFKNGFRDIIDLHILFTEESSDIFWQELLILAGALNFQKELFLACRYSNKLFSTHIPMYVTTEITQYKPHLLFVYDFIFERVLLPNHPLCHVSNYGLAEKLAWIRGHKLKMPTHILLYHFIVKSLIHIVEKILGRYFFTKK